MTRKGFRLDQREGMATVMFTDIADSSTLAGLVGDRAWAARMEAHFTQIRQRVEQAGGQFVKSLGDGTMSSFSTACAALEAAQHIQTDMARQQEEPHLHLRIGMHTGDVIQTKDDFFGSVVNKAARIGALAPPGAIFLSDATQVMVGGSGFAFSDPIQTPLKGFDGDHTVFSLDWRGA
ncbi:adenylate/guanylate cyclase domain-containing protein [Aestuariivita boseongensis]|uniref:adenylate/guanylate cyclase domain-containing protein n=1 Tax=Aestuariivita boseongensis TaxID=1470562 RepID=UPI00068211DE|nr:adenylate/guanylate cyclase domain-containing protein [Aestuariivita boseongensis]